MNEIHRFSSRRQRLDYAFLSTRLKNVRSYKRIAGYFRSSIFELVGEEICFAEATLEELPAAALAESPIYRGGEQLQPWQRSFVTLFLQHRDTYGNVCTDCPRSRATTETSDR